MAAASASLAQDNSQSAGAGVGRRLRVLLADDHALIRVGLKLLIDAQPDMHVIGEAGDGEAACRAVRELSPDIVVIDLSMPRLGGAEATARIRREHPDVRVLVLTVHEESPYLSHLLKAGASGYVLKRAAPDDLVHAIRVVSRGGVYVDPSVAGKLVANYVHNLSDELISDDVLSDREREVLVRIAHGYGNKEIARDLQLSVKTVETYKARFGEKLGVRSRVEIARYAAKHGLIDPLAGHRDAE
ncbi:MAG TPA: response regulator transcription factor [Gemmatimonadaceae bacterium]